MSLNAPYTSRTEARQPTSIGPMVSHTLAGLDLPVKQRVTVHDVTELTRLSEEWFYRIWSLSAQDALSLRNDKDFLAFSCGLSGWLRFLHYYEVPREAGVTDALMLNLERWADAFFGIESRTMVDGKPNRYSFSAVRAQKSLLYKKAPTPKPRSPRWREIGSLVIE